MAWVSTVYLNQPAAPGGKDFLSGYISHDNDGITVADRDDFRGNNVWFPNHIVLRIEKRTEWR